VRAELGAELHLLGCLLELLGDVSKEEEWSRDCDGKQLWGSFCFIASVTCS
jgi:hypothetical protein